MSMNATKRRKQQIVPTAPRVVVVCPYCRRPDPTWNGADLKRGKRGMQPPPGVEYHCEVAYYGAS